MALVWLLAFVFVGASSASDNSTSVLQRYPSVVQVEALSLSGWATWGQTCAGSVLNNLNILTAASCFAGSDYQPANRRIRAGANIRNTGGFIYNVQSATNNDNWNNTNANYDVSVVRLTSTLIYTDFVRQAIIAATGSVIPSGLSLAQLGWQNRNSSTLNELITLTTNVTVCGLSSNQIQSLCSLTYWGIEELNNANPGSPLFFNNITVGVIAGGSIVTNTSSFISASVAFYTSWIISVVS